MGFCIRSGGSIFYELKGTGEPLVLLRGLGRSSQYWLGFDRLMAAHFQVIVIDLRGLGRSTVPMTRTDTVADLARDVLAVLDELAIESCHVLGLSFGGMVAISLAAEEPRRVKSLIVIASSSRGYQGMRISPSALRRLVLALLRNRFHETLAELVLSPLLSLEKKLEIVDSWKSIRNEEGFPFMSIIKQIRAAARFGIPERIDCMALPTLILCGSQDAFVPMNNSIELHRLLPGSRLHIVPNAGHEISIGFETEIAGLIEDFLHNYALDKG